MAKGDIRSRALHVCRELTTNFWLLGELLAEIHAKHQYKSWGFETFAAYVETELGISRSRANRLVGVVEVFGDHKHELDGVSWSALAEALPIARKTSVEEAIAIAKMGLEEVRHWKEARRAEQKQMNLPLETQQDWQKVPPVWMPPDAWRDWETAMELAKRACAANEIAVTEKNPWQLFQAIARSALVELNTQIPIEPDVREAIPESDELH